MATTPQAAEVRRFTGFIAIDNSTHNTEKAAIEHSIQVKTANALTDLAVKSFAAAEAGENKLDGFSELDSGGKAILTSDDLALWLMANREAIKAALTQEVRLRKPRGPKPKKDAAAAPASAPAA